MDLLFLKKVKFSLENCDNPVTVNTLNAWRAVCRFEGRTKVTSALTPIVNNPDFHPGRFDGRFKFWENHGINQLKDVFDEEGLMSLEDFRQKYQLLKQDFFSFFTD